MSGGKGNVSSDLRMGSARKETDNLSTGSLLLSFMTQASGNVKTALEKPANFKRNINHRRYLQKQLRNFSKKKGDTPTKKSSSSTKFKSTGKQSYKAQGVSYIKDLRDSWIDTEKERTTLKERTLPASFWQEPLMPTFQQDMMNNMYQYQQRPDDYTHTAAGPNQDIESYLSGWNSAVAAYGDTTNRAVAEFSPTEAIPSITSEDGLSEDFMTGEELTRNLDIKDLYVPEMYSADKLLNDVQETLLAGQISPSQYYLPSPSPYNTEQAYFNFTSFEQDPQGLPPIAMAFFGQNPLAQC